MSGDAMIVKPKKILYTIWTHTKDFGLCQSWRLQCVNLCDNFQFSCVMWWPWHGWAIWWFLFWSCTIWGMLMWHFQWQGLSRITLCINKISPCQHP
jgi:hypothetical protein